MNGNRISPNVFILTCQELDEIKNQAFKRGVERGKFEASPSYRDGPYARNCAHWKNGICDYCGAQSQGCEVNADFKCPHFQQRQRVGTTESEMADRLIPFTEAELDDLVSAIGEAQDELCTDLFGTKFPEATSYYRRLETIAERLRTYQ